MEIQTIRKICQEENLLNYDLFVEFFSEAFPNESNQITSYCREWIGRFKSGDPTVYMDNDRLSIYRRLIDKKV